MVVNYLYSWRLAIQCVSKMMSPVQMQQHTFKLYDASQQVLLEKAWLRKHEDYLFPAFEHAIIKRVSTDSDPAHSIKTELGEEPVIVPASSRAEAKSPGVLKRKRAGKGTGRRGRPPKKRSKSGAENRSAKKLKKKTTHYRVKWSDADVDLLWNAIRTCGNKWSLIKAKLFPKRTNDQVKDKGKRLLRRLGWETGITKSDSICACASAKRLASGYLAGLASQNAAQGASIMPTPLLTSQVPSR